MGKVFDRKFLRKVLEVRGIHRIKKRYKRKMWELDSSVGKSKSKYLNVVRSWGEKGGKEVDRVFIGKTLMELGEG